MSGGLNKSPVVQKLQKKGMRMQIKSLHSIEVKLETEAWKKSVQTFISGMKICCVDLSV